MDSQPAEILEMILDHLPTDSLIAAKLVCKRWYLAIRAMRKKALLISDFQTIVNCRWFQSERLIGRTDAIESAHPHLIRSLLDQAIFDKLKRLYIFKKSLEIRTPADSLSRFTQLEMLEIVHSEIDLEPHLATWTLPNLQHLNIEATLVSCSVTLDAPKLTKLSIKYVLANRFAFRHPHSVRLLEMKLVDSFEDDENFVRSFVNLQQFYCNQIERLSGDFLFALASLRELHFQGPADVLNSLQEQQRQFARNQLRLYYFGLNLNSLTNFAGLESYGNHLPATTVRFYSQNYGKLAPVIPFIRRINYSQLEQAFAGQVPSDFIGRFVNLDFLVIDKEIKDLRQLGNLLNKCIGLSSLSIRSARVSQEFLDSLPVRFRVLKDLTVHQAPILNFEFLRKFEHLEMFGTDQSLPVELACELIAKFDKLKEFSFVGARERTTVLRYDNGSQMIYTDEGLEMVGNLNGVFAYFGVKYKPA